MFNYYFSGQRKQCLCVTYKYFSSFQIIGLLNMALRKKSIVQSEIDKNLLHSSDEESENVELKVPRE